MPSVLIIDDEPNIRRMVGALLSAEGYDVRDAANGAEGIAAIADDEPDVALLDLMMPGQLDGIATLTKIREGWRELPVIMMSGRASLSDAVRATKLGAVNFLEKPLSPEAVLLALGSALELRRSRRVTRALREDLGLTGNMVGSSKAMQQVAEIIARVAPTDSRVLVGGESGTGKELVAAAIHEQSSRRDKPFVRVNCAAIPRDLVESEMFGHEKGSFTGATNTRVGRFELAHTGTLFLDEIGDLSIEAQAKLLRAIEAREIQRVGGNKTISVDVRVIAATNKDLSKAVTDGTFREDLYFRLNVIPIQLPPLRMRGDDVIQLIHHFSDLQYQRSSRSKLQWSEEALDLMNRHTWPGNVRELANIVERISIMNSGGVVKPSDVAAVIPTFVNDTKSTQIAADSDKSLSDTLDEVERNLINDALLKSDGSVAEAARKLQTDRPNLYRRMKRLGLSAILISISCLSALAVSAGDARATGLHIQPNSIDRQLIYINPIVGSISGTGDTIANTDTITSTDTIVTPDAVPDADTTSPSKQKQPTEPISDTIEHIQPLLSLVKTYSVHKFGFGLTSGRSFNRVEGLPVHFGPTYTYSTEPLLIRARAYGIVRSARSFKLQAPHGGYNNHIDAFIGPTRSVSIGARWFRVVSPIESWNMSEPENGISTFLLHRDFRDWYQKQGVTGTASWQLNKKALLTASYGLEKWSSIDARDPFTILRNSHPWRPNPIVDDGEFKIATFNTIIDTRNDERDPAVGWFINAGYEYGYSPHVTRTSFSNVISPDRVKYGRATADIRRYNRLSPRNQINGRLYLGGWLHGDELPLQRRFSIGGPGNLPGYDFRKAIGTNDGLTCGAVSFVAMGMPALCDRVMLAQLEFRRELASQPYDLLNNPAIRIRSAGFTVNPQGVLFLNAGQGWRLSQSTPYPSRLKADFGTGIDFGLLGIYAAKSITDWSEAPNIFVRVTRRF